MEHVPYFTCLSVFKFGACSQIRFFTFGPELVVNVPGMGRTCSHAPKPKSQKIVSPNSESGPDPLISVPDPKSKKKLIFLN